MAALVGGVPASAADAVRAAGWRLSGVLLPELFATPADDDRAGYLDDEELRADGRVDLAVVDAGAPEAVRLLPGLRAAGLLSLLVPALPVPPDVLHATAAVDGPPVLAAVERRWQAWARTVRAALPLAGPPLQVTVRGWPAGPAAALELVDLVALWCGDVVGTAAAPAPLPADRLPDGLPVAWSVLTASGATVLVAHGGPSVLVRVSTATARLEAAPGAVRWAGGDGLPLLLPPAHLVPPGTPGDVLGVTAAAAALRAARGGGDPSPGDAASAPAGLGELLAAARVLAALRESARTERFVAVS